MSALHRVRSQHFVSSPRKTATPAKHKVTRHSSKRRRLGSSAFAPLPSNNVSSDDEDQLFHPSQTPQDALGSGSLPLNADPLSLPGPSRSRSREANDVVSKRSKSRSKRKGGRQSGGRKEINGHEYAQGNVQGDVFSMSDEDERLSPKKRKRAAGLGHGKDTKSEGSSSWVEMEDEEEEEEPEFIAESKSDGPISPFTTHTRPYSLGRDVVLSA